MGQAVVESHQQCLARAFLDVSEAVAQAFVGTAFEQGLQWPGVVVGDVVRAFFAVVIGLGQGHFLRCGTQAVDRLVADDGGHPGHCLGSMCRVFAGLVPDGDEGLLQRIFSPCLVADQAHGNAEQSAGTGGIQCAEGCLVAKGDTGK